METTPDAARFLEAAEARLVSVLSHGSGASRKHAASGVVSMWFTLFKTT